EIPAGRGGNHLSETASVDGRRAGIMKSVLPLFHTLLVCTLLGMTSSRSLAWGPHSEITQAAVDTLGSDDAIVRELGPALSRLRDYCWMADQRRQLRQESAAGWFY